MELLSLLYQLIFMPLQIIFEVIYYLAFRVIGNPGISIIALSFIVNLLVLPLYNRADAIQEAERDMEVKLSKGVEHIKKTFKGDEQLMMLQTYYRQNGYSPLDSIKGSISLFLEIPFFVAAYQFLSHLEILNGARYRFRSSFCDIQACIPALQEPRPSGEDCKRPATPRTVYLCG